MNNTTNTQYSYRIGAANPGRTYIDADDMVIGRVDNMTATAFVDHDPTRTIPLGTFESPRDATDALIAHHQQQA